MSLSSLLPEKIGERILLITGLYYPNVAGSSRLLKDVVDHLNTCGYSVEVLALGVAEAPAIHAFDSKQNYKIWRVPPTKIRGTTNIQVLMKILSLHRHAPYDLIFSGVGYPLTIVAYFARAFIKKPYMSYCYGEDLTGVPEKMKKLLSVSLRNAFALLPISRFAESELVNYGVSEKIIHRVPCAIEMAPYVNVDPQAVEKMRQEWGLSGKRVIFTMARLEARKGHDIILQGLPSVVEQIPDVHYLIVGKGDPAPLTELATSLGVADRLTIVSYVSDEDLPVVYSLCEVYAMVSRRDPVTQFLEGFGICYLEAAACGKPCVAGNEGGCPDAVADGETGILVDPTSPEQVSAALLKILTDPVKAQEMGEKGRQRVKREFTRKTMLETVEAIVGKVIHS